MWSTASSVALGSREEGDQLDRAGGLCAAVLDDEVHQSILVVVDRLDEIRDAGAGRRDGHRAELPACAVVQVYEVGLVVARGALRAHQVEVVSVVAVDVAGGNREAGRHGDLERVAEYAGLLQLDLQQRRADLDDVQLPVAVQVGEDRIDRMVMKV